MQLEFHQLERRWEQLRVDHPQRRRRLLASLADSGQQVPIVVVAMEGVAEVSGMRGTACELPKPSKEMADSFLEWWELLRFF